MDKVRAKLLGTMKALDGGRDFQYWLINGDVYRNRAGDPTGVNGIPMGLRWEASIEWFERALANGIITGFEPIEESKSFKTILDEALGIIAQETYRSASKELKPLKTRTKQTSVGIPGEPTGINEIPIPNISHFKDKPPQSGIKM